MCVCAVLGRVKSNGGYIAELGESYNDSTAKLEELASLGWLDARTAAVTLEFVLYNANVNLVSLVLVVFEFPVSGGADVNSIIFTLRFYRSTTGATALTEFIFEGVFALFTMHLIYHEGTLLKKLHGGYFYSIANCLDFIALLLSMTVLGLFVTYSVQVSRLVRMYFSGAEIVAYLQYLGSIDTALTAVFGFLVLIGMFKFLHLLRFNPLFFRFLIILKLSFPLIVATGVFICLSSAAFASLMYCLFGNQIEPFSSMQISMTTLFTAILGDLDFEDLNRFLRFWAPLLYLCLIIFLFNLMLNVLVIVLCSALEEVGTHPPPSEDTEILWLMINRVVQWFGLEVRTIGRQDTKESTD